MRAAFASILIFLFCFLLLIPITDFLAIQGFTSIELEELSGLDKKSIVGNKTKRSVYWQKRLAFSDYNR